MIGAFSRRPTTIAVLWLVAAAVGFGSIAYWVTNPTLPGTPWQFPLELADFRDTVYGPGGYLLAGHNPYDPGPYLSSHPWAQEFDPYAPAWLLLGTLLAPLPFKVAASLYLLMGVSLAAILLAILLRWTLPTWMIPGLPLGLAFLYLWSPGRYALQNAGTLFVMLGWVLVMRAVIASRRDSSEPSASGDTRMAALGVALSLIKPQFGLPVLAIAIVGGRWDAAWRGVLGISLASLPFAVACTVAAGGPIQFVQSIIRDIQYASSANSSLGLASSDNGRSDLLGLIARLGVENIPGWIAIVVPIVAIILCIVVVRARSSALIVAVGTAAAVLLGFPHASYDLFILVVPFCLALQQVELRNRLTKGEWLIALLAALPVLHLHRASRAAIPALSQTGTEVVDATALLAALLLCVLASVVQTLPRRGARGMPVTVRREDNSS